MKTSPTETSTPNDPVTLTPIQLKVLRSFFNTGTLGTGIKHPTPKERKELQELLEILCLTNSGK